MKNTMYWAHRAAIDASKGCVLDIDVIKKHLISSSHKKINKELTAMKRHSPHFKYFESFKVLIPIYEEYLKNYSN